LKYPFRRNKRGITVVFHELAVLRNSVVPHERTNAITEALADAMYSCTLIVATFLFVTFCFSRIVIPKATCRWKGRIVTKCMRIDSLNRKLAIVSAMLRDSVVGIATSYRLDDLGVLVIVPVGSNIFSSPRRSDRL
jgi:hypothetical protein